MGRTQMYMFLLLAVVALGVESEKGGRKSLAHLQRGSNHRNWSPSGYGKETEDGMRGAEGAGGDKPEAKKFDFKGNEKHTEEVGNELEGALANLFSAMNKVVPKDKEAQPDPKAAPVRRAEEPYYQEAAAASPPVQAVRAPHASSWLDELDRKAESAARGIPEEAAAPAKPVNDGLFHPGADTLSALSGKPAPRVRVGDGLDEAALHVKEEDDDSADSQEDIFAVDQPFPGAPAPSAAGGIQRQPFGPPRPPAGPPRPQWMQPMEMDFGEFD